MLLKLATPKPLTLLVAGLVLSAAVAPMVSRADEPGPGLVYPKQARKRAALVVAPPVAETKSEPHASLERETRHVETKNEMECDWGVRLAGGLPIWFFEKEGNIPGAGAYIDTFNTNENINLRVGVEGREMFLGQDVAQSAAEFPGKGTKITYLRIPFSAEYILPTGMESTDLFLGGGPDIVHTANDIGSTTVGGHLSARLNYAFYDGWGVALEAGYMWGEANRPGKDVNLDGAYITPTINYTF